MSGVEKPLLITFLGSIGSGKSYFARQLAEKLGVIRLNPDSARIAMFGSLDALNNRPDQGEEYNQRLFGLLNYVMEQALAAGNTVVYDTAKYNGLANRQELSQLAAKVPAQIVYVWIQTPRVLAIERVTSREETVDQRRLGVTRANEILDFHEAKFSHPLPEEFVIKISGQIPFDEQYVIFKKELARLSY
jgi:predicted kinase